MPFFYLQAMYIYNITFVVEDSRLETLIEWIRTVGAPRLAIEPASQPMLSMVDGIDDDPDMAKSVALQLHFKSLTDLEQWQEKDFAPTMEIYAREFAPEPLFFATLLRQLPITFP